ncbi:MAG: NTP transferase domain-containing protein [Anaerolineae bacterium]
MAERTHPTYPVFVMCGRDAKRRRLLEVLDPEEKYKSKALLPFEGKRLIDWPLEALRASRHVEGLYLIGLSEADAAFDYPVHYVPTDTTADFSQKLSDGLAYLGALGKHPDLVVISSSDAPGLRPESVEAFFRRLVELGDHDFVLSLVPEAVVRDLFPASGRVVARFRDHQVFPGELYALSPRAIQIGQEVIRDINSLRRRFNRQRRKISLGPLIRYVARKPQMWGVILKYLLRQATLEDAERAFSAAFDCKAKAVLIPDPGFGMDMDLPEDYERLKLLVPHE